MKGGKNETNKQTDKAKRHQQSWEKSGENYDDHDEAKGEEVARAGGAFRTEELSLGSARAADVAAINPSKLKHTHRNSRMGTSS